jgi:benzoyl-CoA reductase/2-hydroxyglutaryl-CoA dehydratase subunit BcrC/BadD/HgdB
MQQQTIGEERREQYQQLLNLLGEQPADAGGSAPSLRATRMRSIINTHRLAGAYNEDSRVAYVSEQFPTELVFAFDAIPWNIESMAILLAQSLDVNRIFQLTQEREISRDICSFLRGPYGMILENCYPTPDVVLTHNQPCEGLAKLEWISGKGHKAPVLSLHAPHTIDEDSLAYLIKQIQSMLSQIGEVLGVPYDPGALRAVVELSNQARAYYCKTAHLLKSHRLPGVSRELQEIFGMNYFGSRGNAQVCKVLYEEAVQLIGTQADARRRVLWIGQVPEEAHELLQHLRQAVEVVFWAPLWEANMLSLDEDRPLHSIAERAILYHWKAEQMRTETLQICDDYAIEGLVIANVWGCRNMMGISPIFRDLAASKKLKHLTLNVDLVDRNNYAANHIKNRVDAFLELMS